MTCHTGPGFAVCMPGKDYVRRVMFCETCKGVHRHLQRVEMWHDTTYICCACGADDLWVSAEPNPDRAARARQSWEEAGGVSYKELMDRFDREWNS